MNLWRAIWRRCRVAILGVLFWAAAYGPALAANEDEEAVKGGPASYILPYVLVLLGIALGMLVVCRSARRRERPRPEQFAEGEKPQK